MKNKSRTKKKAKDIYDNVVLMSKIQIEKDNIKQKILLEFFELVEKPAWEVQLRQILQRHKMNIWNIDVSLLLKKLLDDAAAKENLKHAALIVLICSILLKTKSRRLGLYELEASLKEELEDIVSAQSEPLDVARVLSEDDLQKYNNLLELERKLKRLFGKGAGIPRTKKSFADFIIRIESYFKLKHKLLGALKVGEIVKYSYLKKSVDTNNSIIMGLLLLHTEEKIILTQRVPYDEIFVKRTA